MAHLRARKSLAYSLDHLFEGRDRVSFHKIQSGPRDLEGIRGLPRQATQVKDDLRDYQKERNRLVANAPSLWFWWDLADDMGLGRPLQTIAF